MISFMAVASHQTTTAAQNSPQASPVVIPFELVTRHIVIKVKINNSAPLSFILDTGDKVAIVDLKRAESLGLTLKDEVRVGGAGAGVLKGSTASKMLHSMCSDSRETRSRLCWRCLWTY